MPIKDIIAAHGPYSIEEFSHLIFLSLPEALAELNPGDAVGDWTVLTDEEGNKVGFGTVMPDLFNEHPGMQIGVLLLEENKISVIYQKAGHEPVSVIFQEQSEEEGSDQLAGENDPSVGEDESRLAESMKPDLSKMPIEELIALTQRMLPGSFLEMLNQDLISYLLGEQVHTFAETQEAVRKDMEKMKRKKRKKGK